MLHRLPQLILLLAASGAQRSAAAFVATTAESFIGAVWQAPGKLPWLSNELVNLANTVIGAAVAVAIFGLAA